MSGTSFVARAFFARSRYDWPDMELERGAALGHYEIEDLIGAGGMGQVYRARDTKLGRAVAIKVLPEGLARDKERLDRFEREARLLAALNHPNIATLHGMERSGELRFLVMELVEGETLAERIARGSIPLDEAVALFLQIAEGLEAVHERGIVHRDLKPANIKITPEGRVKILDFGLAKAFTSDEGVSAETSQSPTLTKGTALGAIMGTASYMSPEQARGKPIDKRTDIWAFGCCLYEALTDRKAFDGETVSDIIGSVLRDEPNTSVLPHEVTRLIERCLKKNPRERVRDIGDIRLELPETLTVLPGKPILQRWLLWVAASFAAGLVTGVGIWSAGGSHGSPEAYVRRASITLPEGQRLWSGGLVGSAVELSPDGSKLVYLAYREGREELFLRKMDDGTTTPLDGTRGAAQPFFSPDGGWIGFFVDGTLKKIRVDSGGAVEIGRVRGVPAGASWGVDGYIYFAIASFSLRRVDANGGISETIAGETDLRWPQILPGGGRLLLTRWVNDSNTSSLVVRNLGTGETHTIVEGAGRGRYLESGHVVFNRGSAIMAAPFDLERGELSGPEVSVGSVQGGGPFLYNFSVADDGTFAFVPSFGEVAFTSLVWVDRDGRVSESIDEPREYVPHPRLSHVRRSYRRYHRRVRRFDSRHSDLRRRPGCGEPLDLFPARQSPSVMVGRRKATCFRPRLRTLRCLRSSFRRERRGAPAFERGVPNPDVGFIRLQHGARPSTR